MQFKLLKNIVILFAIVFIFSECRMRTVTMNTMRPAEITFPSYVNGVLLLDRTEFDNKVLGILESILTGEIPGEDKAGAQETLSSMQMALMSSPRFEVKRANERLTGNSITSAFPDPIPWSKIESLCQQYGTEAIVSLEIFNSNFIVTHGSRKIKQKVKEGDEVKEVEVDGFYAEGIASVKVGFRLYDPKARTIVDQQLITRRNTWEATGTTLLEAMSALIAKSEATKQVARASGSNYAHKIAPMPVRLSRQFYSKSRRTPAITAGRRQADVNDWHGAIQTWESGIARAKNKDAGKLSYNIAIAHEVLGDLEAAKNWSGRAYVQHGNKKARTYHRALERRQEDELRVEKQLRSD